MRLAHLSDPHLGPLPRPSLAELRGKRLSGFLSWQFRRSFRHRREVLEAVLADLLAWQPDHIVLTGDLANLALPEEFVRASAWLRRLGGPERVSLVPGNHDAYVDHVWRFGWKLWAPWMSGDRGETGFPWLRRRPPVLLIGLSSAVPSPWFKATGEIGDAQLQRLDQLLAQLDDRDGFRIILVHHPPLPEVPRSKALLDRAKLAAVLARHRVDLVLCGHIHRFALGGLAGTLGPIPVLVSPSASLLAPGAKQGGYLRLTFPKSDGMRDITVERRVFDPARRAVVDGGRLRIGRKTPSPAGAIATAVS